MPKAFEERVPYSAIVDRPKLTLPGNARLAVWVIVNVENWEIRRPMPRMVLPPPSGVRIGRGTNTACASASGAFSNA
jgi:hypothetical protein